MNIKMKELYSSSVNMMRKENLSLFLYTSLGLMIINENIQLHRHTLIYTSFHGLFSCLNSMKNVHDYSSFYVNFYTHE